MAAVARPTAHRAVDPSGELYACQRIWSLEKNPAKHGIPAMATDPMNMVQCVMGILFLSPPMRRISCSPPNEWITEPEQRKSRALKKACVNRWKMATQ